MRIKRRASVVVNKPASIVYYVRQTLFTNDLLDRILSIDNWLRNISWELFINCHNR